MLLFKIPWSFIRSSTQLNSTWDINMRVKHGVIGIWKNGVVTYAFYIQVVFANSNHQGDSYSTACKFAINGLKDTQWLDSSELLDDEELEMNELQADQNIPRCPSHATSNKRNACLLCKGLLFVFRMHSGFSWILYVLILTFFLLYGTDMLSKFPPKSVKIKHPFCTKPWTTSLVILKKLFKVIRFLVTTILQAIFYKTFINFLL